MFFAHTHTHGRILFNSHVYTTFTQRMFCSIPNSYYCILLYKYIYICMIIGCVCAVPVFTFSTMAFIIWRMCFQLNCFTRNEVWSSCATGILGRGTTQPIVSWPTLNARLKNTPISNYMMEYDIGFGYIYICNPKNSWEMKWEIQMNGERVYIFSTIPSRR